MSEVRYCYTDPLAAAWMVNHHGVLVVEENGFIHNESETIFDSHVEDCYRGRYYLHPDSLPLLEPKIGDFAVVNEGNHDYLCVIAKFTENGRFRDGLTWDEIPLAAIKRIIQRDGKPFHAPESEAA